MVNRFVIWIILEFNKLFENLKHYCIMKLYVSREMLTEHGTCSIYMLFIWSLLKLVSLQYTLYNRSGIANATKRNA